MLISGGSTGIGFATARMLARRGALVALLARSADKLEAAAAKIARDGGEALPIAVDVSDRAALLSAVTRAETAFGPVDGLFANAGTGGSFAPAEQYDDAVFDEVVRTNLNGTYWLVKRVLPSMYARKRGSILITGSLASERGMPNNVAYVASKHAVLGLARAVAAEAAPHNVRVNCLIPGFIETPMLHDIAGDGDVSAVMAAMAAGVPQGRVGQPDEAAELACFLLSDAAAHITAQSIAVDGGLLGTHIPR